MKSCLRILAAIGLASCVLSGCAPAETDPDGTGGSGGGVNPPGTGGSASGGAPNQPGSGGSASGGVSGSGGSASGGVFGSGGAPLGTGGRGTGGVASGGTSGTGGRANGGAAGIGTGGAGNGGRAGMSGTGGGPAGGGSTGTYNPCANPCRILPVGDSITFGINQEGSYRIELFRKAQAAQQKLTYTGTLQNGPTMVDGATFPRRYEATSGITIDGISTQITRNNTLMMASDIILVHIGTNDMYMSDPGGAPQRLGTLLDKLIAAMPNALIVVAKIIPLPSGANAVKTFNAAIPGLVQTRAAAGKHVIMVDMNTTFPASGMSSDNVHPNPMGYAWMGGVWYDAIGPLLPK